MSEAVATSSARLVCIPCSQICDCPWACAVHRSAFYRIVWEIPRELQGNLFELRRLQRHILFGRLLCAN